MARLARRFLLLGFAVVLATIGVSQPVVAQAPKPRVHVISFGLFGTQDLFRREANAAAKVIASHYGHSGLVVVRANDPRHSEADVAELGETLGDVASVIDRDNDILVLFLTSHGNTDGLAIVKREQRRIMFLTPDGLKGLLAASGIRHRVVILSACYSGVFADSIADNQTLVITAADARHSSFGCSDDNPGDYTWFGQAFFEESFKPGVSITDAFQLAYRRVSAREAQQNLPKSNPQLRGGADVLAGLAAAQQPEETGAGRSHPFAQ